MLITTTPGIEGRPVAEYLGVVTAQGLLGVNAFKDVSAGVRAAPESTSRPEHGTFPLQALAEQAGDSGRAGGPAHVPRRGGRPLLGRGLSVASPLGIACRPRLPQQEKLHA